MFHYPQVVAKLVLFELLFCLFTPMEWPRLTYLLSSFAWASLSNACYVTALPCDCSGTPVACLPCPIAARSQPGQACCSFGVPWGCQLTAGRSVCPHALSQHHYIFACACFIHMLWARANILQPGLTDSQMCCVPALPRGGTGLPFHTRAVT